MPDEIPPSELARSSESRDPLGQTSIHVRAAVSGDRESLSWLVERLSPFLIAHAAWRLGPNLRRYYDPEDIVADAWARLLPTLGELNVRDGRHTPVLLRFLATTMTHRISNLVKKHLRPGREGEAKSAGNSEPLSQLAAEVSGVITAAVKRETRAVVLRALDELDPMDKEIIFLRGIEQRSYEVIAVLLGLSAEASAMRFSRALRRLKERIPESAASELQED